MKHKTIAVIGLGQFGGTVAKMLASMDHEVLGVDIDPEVVQKISPFITHAIVADTTDEEAIKELALSQFDMVIVAIGGNLQANLICLAGDSVPGILTSPQAPYLFYTTPGT